MFLKNYPGVSASGLEENRLPLSQTWSQRRLGPQLTVSFPLLHLLLHVESESEPRSPRVKADKGFCTGFRGQKGSGLGFSLWPPSAVRVKQGM